MVGSMALRKVEKERRELKNCEKITGGSMMRQRKSERESKARENGRNRRVRI